MIRVSDLIKMMSMDEYIRIVGMKESLCELYEGNLGRMTLRAYMRMKDMIVYSIETASVEEEEDCYTAFLNITVKDVE